MTGDHHLRKDDIDIAELAKQTSALAQEVKDFKESDLRNEFSFRSDILERLTKTQKDSEEKFGKIEEKFGKVDLILEKHDGIIASINRPMLIIGWGVAIIVAGILGVLGSRWGKIIYDAFQK